MFVIQIQESVQVELPNIKAVGGTEEEAVGIFVILLNASMLQGHPGRLYTNFDEKNGVLYTTFVVGIDTFEDLKRYMKDVYDVTVVMSEE